MCCGLEILVKAKKLGGFDKRKTLKHDLSDIGLLCVDVVAVVSLTSDPYIFTIGLLRFGQFTRVLTVYEWVMSKKIDRKPKALTLDEEGRILKYNPSKLFDILRNLLIFNLLNHQIENTCDSPAPIQNSN